MFRLVAAFLVAALCAAWPCFAMAKPDQGGAARGLAQNLDSVATTNIFCPQAPCSLDLPIGGNTAIFSSAGRTKIVVEYGLEARIVLIITDFNGQWDREQAMVGKMAEVRNGVSPAGKNASVSRYNLIQLGEIGGYEYAIRTRDGSREQWLLGFAGVGAVSSNSLRAVSLVVESGANCSREKVESLFSVVRTSIRLQPEPLTPKAPAVAEGSGPDTNWDKARRLLAVGGTAGSGTNSHASVNGNVVRVGDVLSVRMGGRRYRFRVSGIDSASGKVDFAPMGR